MRIGNYSKPSIIMIFVLLIAGCSSRIPFTKALIDEYKLSPNETKRLQFYVSHSMLFEREQTSIDKDIDETYALKKVEDRYIKQIEFRRMTPCIVTEVQGDRLKVALEPRDKLDFKLDPSHRKGKVFVYMPDILLKEPENRPRPKEAGYYGWAIVGKETYENQQYEVLCRHSLPYLLVDEKSLRKLVIEQRVAPGMRQGEQVP